MSGGNGHDKDTRSGPKYMADADMVRPLPKRFYKDASFSENENQYEILLDGKAVKTPLKAPFKVPSKALAKKIVEEWLVQDEHIDPAKMPFTKLANTAIDRVMGRESEIIEEIAKYSASDLLCYRAENPEELVERQAEAWDPILKWLEADHKLNFMVTSGIIFKEQPKDALEEVQRLLKDYTPFELCALHNITTLTGSALLMLAFAKEQLTMQETWETALIDEDWQIEKWGEDEDAKRQREKKWSEMQATCHFFTSLSE